MSGPKVVRIVTREELLAICEAHMARLDAAINQWAKSGQRNDVLAGTDIAAMGARRDQIAQLLKAEDFMAVQKQAPLEIDFLKRDTQVRLDIAAKKAFEARQRGRRNGQAGRVLLAALEKAGHEVTGDLRRTLENAAGESAEVDSAFSRAFALLTPDNSSVASDQQRQLAAYHAETVNRQMFPDWLSKQTDAYSDTFRKLDQALAELGAIEDVTIVSPLALRAEALSEQLIDGRTPLLIDSLVHDVQTTLKAARSRQDLIGLLAELEAELKQYSVAEVQLLSARIAAASAERDANVARELVAELSAWLETQRQVAANVARREAMLKGLSELGYAVNEGLETLWAQDGKVVLRKATSPDYGIEVAGGQAGKMQVRVVGYGVPGEARDTVRDRDMETIWCGDFGKLQASLADSGSDLVIEKALGVGATPVKVIAGGAPEVSVDAKRPGFRTNLR